MAKGFLYRFCMCMMGRKGFIVLWKAALSNHGSPRVVVTRRTTTDQGPRRSITAVDTRSRVTEDEAGWAEQGREQDLEKIPRYGGIPMVTADFILAQDQGKRQRDKGNRKWS